MTEIDEVKLVRDTAFADGKKAASKETAKNMLAQNFNLALICELTGLTAKEIEAL